jgi:cytidyltransferase-like protein
MNKILNKSTLKNFFSNRVKKNIILTHGVFDIMHIGHLNHFNALKKKFPDHKLIVSITSEKFVLKGPGRPVFNDEMRSTFLSELNCVDYVFICNDYTAIPAIRLFRPQIYAKGNDYAKSSNDLSKNILKEIKEAKKCGGKIYFTNETTSSSSFLINNHLKPLDNKLALKIANLKKKYTIKKIENIIQIFSKKKVLFIGDVIMDDYITVIPRGKTPKENLINNIIKDKKRYPGGVIPAVNNASSFCKNISLLTVASTKKYDESLIKKSLLKNIKPIIFNEKNYRLIEKSRFVERSYGIKKLFQVTKINENFYSNNLEKKVSEYLNKKLSTYDIVVVTDFGHNFLTPKIINVLIKKSKKLSVNCQSNSLNYGYNVITKFKSCDMICIDEQEARLAVRDNKSDIINIAKKLYKSRKYKKIFITLGSKGVLYKSKKNYEIFPVLNNNIVDTLGAGDAFFSFASIFTHFSSNNDLVSLMGNIAGGIKVNFEGHKRDIKISEVLKTIETLYK